MSGGGVISSPICGSVNRPAHPEILAGSPGVEPHCKSEGAGFSGPAVSAVPDLFTSLTPRPQVGESVLLKAARVAGVNKSGTASPATWPAPKFPRGARRGAAAPGSPGWSPAPHPGEPRLPSPHLGSRGAEGVLGEPRLPPDLPHFFFFFHLCHCYLSRPCQYLPTHNREPCTTHYCTVQHHVPIDPYAERIPRADCSSNTIRDSISRVAPSLRARVGARPC